MLQPISSLNLDSDIYQAFSSLGYNNAIELTEEIVRKKLSPDKWIQLCHIPETETALDMYEKDFRSGTVYTFNKNVDKILENEMVPGNIIEFCGQAGTGKTQLWY